MRVAHHHGHGPGDWDDCGRDFPGRVDLVLLFGQRNCLPELYARLRDRFPRALILGCSTAGEISDVRVFDGCGTATLVGFDAGSARLARLPVAGDSRATGLALAAELAAAGLRHVFVLADGLAVNGAELVAGLRQGLAPGIGISGGLAGDGGDFRETAVVADAPPQPGQVAALGLYGADLEVRSASLGGWDPFGPDRLITRARGNVLFELDGQPALALYKRYLGDEAAGLPATGLLFPLELRGTESAEGAKGMEGVEGDGGGLVRTILAVDETDGSMTFAGDMPEGSYARLMKANVDRLIDGAGGAALALGAAPADLALLISCVGRKLVLRQRVEEEVERVREVLGPGPVLAGFYSYGEISPRHPGGPCELHNQTMTITVLRESRTPSGPTPNPS